MWQLLAILLVAALWVKYFWLFVLGVALIWIGWFCRKEWRGTYGVEFPAAPS
jgi:hypothetical protein